MKKRQIRVRWFISFFVILLISMIPAALIYRLSIDAIERQAVETNRAHQRLLEQTLEGVVEDVDRIADNLTVNAEFAFVRHIAASMTTEQRWRLYKFGKDTFRYMLLNDTFVTQRYVYLKNSDLLLGSAYQRLAQAYDGGLLGGSLTCAQWAERLGKGRERAYIPATLNLQRGVFYLRGLRSPTARGGEQDAVLVVFISGQAVTDVMTEGALNTEAILCVLDEDGRLLLSNADQETALEAVAQAQHETPLLLDGRRYFCQISTGAASRLTYICYSSYETAYRQAQLVKNLSALFMALGMLIGLMAALLMTRQHYMPVKRIISRLEAAPPRQNEYDRILSYIEENQSARQSLQQQLAEGQALLRREQLARFLTGRMQWNPDTLRLLAGCRIALNRPAYAVAVVSMSEFSAETGANMARNVAELMREILLRRLPGLSMEDTMAEMNLLLLMGMEAEEGRCLHQHMQALEEELRSAYRMETAIGLSNLSPGAQRLPELYRQAAAALEFAQMHRESTLVCYPPAAPSGPYVYPLEKEMLLVQAVSAGQTAQAMEILEEVFGRALSRPDVVMQECLRVDLIATCLRIFALADRLVPRESWDGGDAGRRLMGSGGLSELSDDIREVLARLCQAIRDQKEQGKASQSDRIRDMVEAHWQDETLSVASIAETLNLHPSYVSRLFKEEQGIGLLEYIHRYRVERACVLLCQSSAPVSEIAAQCGYTSDASFIRVFRQYRGTTPGKFREEARTDGERRRESEG